MTPSDVRRVRHVEAGEDSAELSAVLSGELVVLPSRRDILERVE
jgi:hypothetical protein